MESKCEHIFGYQEGVDEAWLTYEPKDPKLYSWPDVIFKYCPLCGERLELKIEK